MPYVRVGLVGSSTADATALPHTAVTSPTCPYTVPDLCLFCCLRPPMPADDAAVHVGWFYSILGPSVVPYMPSYLYLCLFLLPLPVLVYILILLFLCALLNIHLLPCMTCLPLFLYLYHITRPLAHTHTTAPTAQYPFYLYYRTFCPAAGRSPFTHAARRFRLPYMDVPTAVRRPYFRSMPVVWFYAPRLPFTVTFPPRYTLPASDYCNATRTEPAYFWAFAVCLAVLRDQV